MIDQEIKHGVEIAKQALHFAIFSNGSVTAKDCREAIITLFGEEVDRALDREFCRTGEQHD